MPHELRRWNAERKSVYASEKYITLEVIYPKQSEHRAGKTLDITPSGREPGNGPDGSGLRGRENSKCKLATLVESDNKGSLFNSYNTEM